FGLVVLADLILALGHLDRLRLPEREGVDRPGGPAPAVRAVAIPGAQRLARDLDRDSAAEALPPVGLLLRAHAALLSLECRPRGYTRRASCKFSPLVRSCLLTTPEEREMSTRITRREGEVLELI